MPAPAARSARVDFRRPDDEAGNVDAGFETQLVTSDGSSARQVLASILTASDHSALK
jgi:microcompartment protein CcmK/EutM